MMKWISTLFSKSSRVQIPEAEYAPMRSKLRMAGLSEAKLRKMSPDARVAALEQAKLDPYDYIYLAC